MLTISILLLAEGLGNYKKTKGETLVGYDERAKQRLGCKMTTGKKNLNDLNDSQSCQLSFPTT